MMLYQGCIYHQDIYYMLLVQIYCILQQSTELVHWMDLGRNVQHHMLCS